MKTFVAILSISLLPLLFVSCQKEVDETFNEDTNEVKIKEIILVDTTFLSPLDTLRKEGFVYDSEGRLAYHYTLLDNLSGVLDTAFRTWYYYTGTTRQPYKSVLKEYNGAILYDYDTSFLSYDMAGYLKKDSMVSGLAGGPSNYSTYEYYKSGNIVTEINRFYGVDPNDIPIVDTIHYHQTISSGNVTSQIDTTFDFRDSYTNSFDIKPNPLYNIAPIRYLPLLTDDPIFDNQCSNNITNYNFTEKHIPTGSQNIQHYGNTFVYNTDGYPVLAKQTDLGSGTPGYLKYIFRYY